MKRVATVALGTLISIVLGAAFWASFPALLGAGSAVGLPDDGAYAFAIVPDVATAVALLAGVVLRHDRLARRLALASLVVFGAASATFNASAALGVTPHGLVSERVAGLPVALSLGIALTPVAGVVLASDLVVRVVANLWPTVAAVSVPPKRPASVAAAEPKESKASESKAGKRAAARPFEELLDEARRLTIDLAQNEGRVITGVLLRERLGVGHARASELLRYLEAEGIYRPARRIAEPVAA